jgi:hypothetical protein
MPLTNPAHAHLETHFTGSEFVRDIVIGMSDRLTVPFALAAGLSGAVESSGIIRRAPLPGALNRGQCLLRTGICQPATTQFWLVGEAHA